MTTVETLNAQITELQGVDCQPFDALDADTYEPRHLLKGTLITPAVRLWVPGMREGVRIHVEREVFEDEKRPNPIGDVLTDTYETVAARLDQRDHRGEPDGLCLHFHLPTGAHVSLAVLAAPLSQRRWEDHLCERLAEALKTDGVAAEVKEGLCGREVWAIDGQKRIAHFGADGFGWCLRTSVRSPNGIAWQDLHFVYQLMANAVVSRNHAQPYPPDTPLDVDPRHA